jgi:hypothetical protein
MTTFAFTRPGVLLKLALWTAVSFVMVSVAAGPSLSWWLLLISYERLTVSPEMVPTDAPTTDHPIKTLVPRATTAFNKVLGRQPSTFELTVAEYLRRYQRSPPPGFETWYEFAVKHDSPIIDEFDIINKTLATFWRLSGLEVIQRLRSVNGSGPQLSHCRSSSDRLQNGCGFLASELLSLLSNAEDLPHLPKVDMFINMPDEPRILPDDGCNADCDISHDDNQALLWTDLSHRDIWNKITTSCHYNDGS